MFIAVPTAAVIKALVLRFVPREPEETEAYVDLVSPQNAHSLQPVVAPATEVKHSA